MLLLLRVLPANGQEVLALMGEKKPRTYCQRKTESAASFLTVFEVINLVVRNFEFPAFESKRKDLLVFCGGFTLGAVLNLIFGTADVGRLVASQATKGR